MTCTKRSKELREWYECLKEKTLDKNNESVAIWSKYKSDLAVTKSLLSLIPKKIKHEIMIPLGPKALVPGKIVHTNEFLVNLGETWFVKRTASQTIEICDRRIKTCDENLQKFEKENELIVNKNTLPTQMEAFGNAERPEIIEFITEEENEEWKKQHRLKEKNYHQQLTELKKKKQSIKTEEDLWKRLDELELQEELEDELNRLNIESDSEEEIFVENLHLPNSSSANNESTIERTNKNSLEVPVSNNSIKIKRKVSFAGDLDSDDEPLRLEITHSDSKLIQNSSDCKEIISPSDIYNTYLNYLEKAPLSVLKNNTNPNQDKELKIIHSKEKLDFREDEECEENCNKIFTGIQFNDVVERHIFDIENIKKKEEKTKKVSQFKAARKKFTIN